MKDIANAADLRSAIAQLEVKQCYERLLIKEQFKNTCESVKPTTMLQNFVGDLPIIRNFKGTVAGTVLGMAVGYLSKKIVFGSSHNPINQLLQTLLKTGITNALNNHSSGIKTTAATLIENFIGKKEPTA